MGDIILCSLYRHQRYVSKYNLSFIDVCIAHLVSPHAT